MRNVIGIDEVGRGCLAGPVVVAAALVKKPIRNRALGTLKDSKKLTKAQREAWFDFFINNNDIEFALAWVYPRQIEKRNISRAANLAAQRAYERLAMAIGEADRAAPGTKARTKAKTKTKVYLDGGLYLGRKEIQPPHAKTVIKGDEKIRAVAIASIIAKVSRDRSMVRLARKYPGYGFEAHKGYATKLHRNAIAVMGISPIHRLTFVS
ncbi:MAG TPA: ribonuclease HII [Candidatus Paceibacterota bacterium]|nr:ribonuclease HII [Candidatus Paceibacterota bacterium]